MPDKNAQLTLVMIIAVILILAASIIIYLSSRESQETFLPLPSEGTNLKLQNYLQSCLADAGIRAVYAIGKHGGYIAPAGDDRYKEDGLPDWQLYFYGQSSFPYGLDKKNVSLSSKKDIKNRINNFVLFELGQCIKSEDFEKEGFKVVKPLSPSILTELGTNSIIITADYPLKLLRNSQEYTAPKVMADIPIRLGHIYDVVYKLLRAVKDNQPYDISLHCLEYGNEFVNVYLLPGKFLKLHAIRVVDVQPLYEKSYPPFEFRIGLKNVDVVGECVG